MKEILLGMVRLCIKLVVNMNVLFNIFKNKGLVFFKFWLILFVICVIFFKICFLGMKGVKCLFLIWMVFIIVILLNCCKNNIFILSIEVFI